MVDKWEGWLKDHIQDFGLGDSVTVMKASKIGNTKGKKIPESFTEDIITSAERERAKKEEDRMHSLHWYCDLSNFSVCATEASTGIVILMIVLLGK